MTAVSSSAGNVQPAAANTNPADAPYPQWSATGDYPLGYKVTENGLTYQAKWFNTGDDPQAQVQYSWQTPWELLGPVLPGDHAPVIARPPVGTYPAWSISTSYQAGDKVLYQSLPYESKWDNQGVSPQGALADPADSPWKALYRIPGEPASTPVQVPGLQRVTVTVGDGASDSPDSDNGLGDGPGPGNGLGDGPGHPDAPGLSHPHPMSRSRPGRRPGRARDLSATLDR